MENKLLELASSQGIWTAMSFVLLYYILKQQEKRDVKQEEREIKYQAIIQELTKALEKIENIENNIKAIKEKIFK